MICPCMLPSASSLHRGSTLIAKWLSLLLCFFLIYSKPFVKPSSVTISSNFYFGFSNSLLKLSLMRQLSLQQHPRNLWLLFSISSTNASNKAWPHIKFRIPFIFSCIPFLHNSWVIFLPNMHNANACTILPCK